MAFDGHVFRIDFFDEVVHQFVRDVFVEDAFVSEFLKIEFEALQLNDCLVWDVSVDDCAEIRLARLGADGRELGAFDFDRVGSIRVSVFKALKFVLERSSGHSWGFCVTKG